MKCYLFANVVVADGERFGAYLRHVPAVIAHYGGRYVVRGGAGRSTRWRATWACGAR
ncbi:DUF1330 domain-containing protein [Sphingobium sp. RSMS]|uniref:DUF1330 domain-containing protein n=1 Tax=Sphingobium sp. RSMS TaxID=520734 RepID=UPI001C110BB7|nr:DUF1330 domain-containing protein [Sphingobium sp. RSMS]UXC89906.1 DUF1330 domain-containing protein [Sphingobium sp. RSMS]